MRVTGISNINFRAGFSTQPSLDLNSTIEWPLQGTCCRGCRCKTWACRGPAWGTVGALGVSARVRLGVEGPRLGSHATGN